MRSIPKALLIHSVIHAKTEESDQWGGERLKGQQELRYVRVEPSSRVIRDKNNAEVQLAATLFFDCKNSRPAGTVFLEDQVIDFQGQKYRIVSVEPLTDRRKLHHYEIGMVKYACKSENQYQQGGGDTADKNGW